LHVFLDTAAVCGALRSGNYDEVAKALKDDGLKLNGNYEAVAGVSVTKNAAKLVIDFLSGIERPNRPAADNAFFAKALAMGMLRWGGIAGRSRNAERLAAYEAAWLLVLDRNLVTKTEKDALLKRLSELNYSSLHTKEKNELSKSVSDARLGEISFDYQSFARIINNKPSFLKKLKSFRGAFTELSAHIDKDAPDAKYELFDDIYDDFCEGWSFSYSSRWVASMIHLAVMRLGLETSTEVEYTCRIKKGNKVYHIPSV